MSSVQIEVTFANGQTSITCNGKVYYDVDDRLNEGGRIKVAKEVIGLILHDHLAVTGEGEGEE